MVKKFVPDPVKPKKLLSKKAGRPRGPRRALTQEAAKEAFLAELAKGKTVRASCRMIDRSEQTYNTWRKTDKAFAERVDALRNRNKPTEVPDFPEFCSKYLFQPLHWHQLQWFDLIEGREPRDLHPSEIYEPGDPNFLLLNTPPEHGKSVTLTTNYVTWRIVKNPSERVIVISKNADMAQQFLYAIKTRLSHPKYNELQNDYGPVGGWKEAADVWARDQIYFGAERDSGEKDPTVQSIGIGGQVYGARSTLILVDDAVVLANAAEFEKQTRWLQQEVLTRLGPTGKLMVVGTRVDAIDLYKELRNPERYPSGESPWTYLAQPAVLEYAEDPKDWVTLWPKAPEPWPGLIEQPDENGMFDRWTGPKLARRRAMLAPRSWAMGYMQAEVEESSAFPAKEVQACIDGMRFPGIMQKDSAVPGIRERGMDGLYVVAGLDPAMTGDTAIVVMGIDRQTFERWVVDVVIQSRPSPDWIKNTIKDLTEKYDINEWRIETNAFQLFLSQDPELKAWLALRGCIVQGHFTGRNKWDVGWGVASMSALFTQRLIHLPTTRSEAVRQLVDQLITWSPETKAKTDAVMALWFASIKAREMLDQAQTFSAQNFQHDRFLSRRGRSRQTVMNLNDLAAGRRMEAMHNAGRRTDLQKGATP